MVCSSYGKMWNINSVSHILVQYKRLVHLFLFRKNIEICDLQLNEHMENHYYCFGFLVVAWYNHLMLKYINKNNSHIPYYFFKIRWVILCRTTNTQFIAGCREIYYIYEMGAFSSFLYKDIKMCKCVTWNRFVNIETS